MCTENDPLLSATEAVETSHSAEMSERNLSYVEKVCLTGAHLLAYSLIGASVFVVLWFAFQLTDISAFQLHVIFSVIGYQLLMSHGILCVNDYAGWSSRLAVVHRRRAHWILQLVGSAFAIAGSIIMMVRKPINFNTTHGRLALAALVFLCISLLNGVLTLYRARVNRIVPARAVTASHLFSGTAAFSVSSVCLAFGYRKESFLEWASSDLSWTMIAMTGVYTLIIIAKPCYVLWKKLTEMIKIKIF